jgi:DNA-binding HxlR family transcriptional regulator
MLDFKSLNPLIHTPMRLGIMTVLSQHESCDFNFLKQTLDTSDGNLSSHITKLETVKYVQVTKTFQNKIPNSSYSLTPIGMQELSTYLQQMRSILKQAEL